MHVCDSAAEQQDVAIAKVVFMIVVEVFVGHIAAAGNAGNAVEYRGLVVHALVDGAKSGNGILEALPETDAHRDIRVVDSNLHIGMSGQQQQRPVLGIDQKVVDDNANAYAALGCAQQLLGGENADVVGAPDEVLNIDGLTGVLREPGAP